MREFDVEATTRGDPQGLELETSFRLTMGGPSFSSFTVILWFLNIYLVEKPDNTDMNELLGFCQGVVLL